MQIPVRAIVIVFILLPFESAADAVAIPLAERCRLNDVKVAVLPGRDRPILGVNALRRLAPVTFSMDPPALEPGRCREDAPTDERTASTNR